MKSIILSAGLGTRLLPLTKERPKSLFPVFNKPILEIQIENFKRAGIDKIGINLHHLSHQIKAYLGDGKKLSVDIEYKDEEEILNTGGGLSNFRDFIGKQEDFVVHNCDILSNVNLNNAMEFHRERNSVVTFILVDNPPGNSVLIDGDMRILDIGGRLGVIPRGKDRLLYGAGIFIYNRRIFDYIPLPDHPFALIPEIINLIQNQPGAVNAYVPNHDTYWRDIGSLSNYFLVHREILTGRLFPLSIVGYPAIDLFSKLGQISKIPGVKMPEKCVIIGENCNISPDFKISGFACIGDNVEINKGCSIDNCIVWSGTKLKRGVYRNMIIGRHYEVSILD